VRLRILVALVLALAVLTLTMAMASAQGPTNQAPCEKSPTKAAPKLPQCK